MIFKTSLELVKNMQTTQDARVLQLHETDNVVITIQTLPAGTTLTINNATIYLEKGLGIGYKLANRIIQVGEKILKYGVSIGSATREIQVGEVVHVHNMKSDYTPTHILKETALKSVTEPS